MLTNPCLSPTSSSADKFRAKNKYPAFSKPVSDNVIDFVEDSSFGIQRQAIVCKNCKARLGHKYSDIGTEHIIFQPFAN